MRKRELKELLDRSRGWHHGPRIVAAAAFRRGRRAGGLRGWSMKRIGLIAAVSTYQRPSAKWANGDPAPGVRQWSWARSWWFEDRLLRCSRGGICGSPSTGRTSTDPERALQSEVRRSRDWLIHSSLTSIATGKLANTVLRGRAPA